MHYYTGEDSLKIVKYLGLNFDSDKKEDFKTELNIEYIISENRNLNIYRFILLTMKAYSRTMSYENSELENKLMAGFLEKLFSNPVALIEIDKIVRPKKIIILSTTN